MKGHHLKSENPHATVLVICTGFLILYNVYHSKWLLITAIFIGLVASISSYIAQKIAIIWMKIAEILGLIMPNILLTAVFFLILTPLGLISRLLSKTDPLSMKNSRGSFFKDYQKKIDAGYFENPW